MFRYPVLSMREVLYIYVSYKYLTLDAKNKCNICPYVKKIPFRTKDNNVESSLV